MLNTNLIRFLLFAVVSPSDFGGAVMDVTGQHFQYFDALGM